MPIHSSSGKLQFQLLVAGRELDGVLLILNDRPGLLVMVFFMLGSRSS
jgi:hypothetical protein